VKLKVATILLALACFAFLCACRFYSSLDTGLEVAQPAMKQEDGGALAWFGSTFRNPLQFLLDSTPTGDSAGQEDSQLAAPYNHMRALIQRTGATSEFNLQDKLFGVMQGILCALLVAFMSGFLLVFSDYWKGGPMKGDKRSILGYVLSLDFGFILLAFQDFWSQDRLWSVECHPLSAPPELAIIMLVGCAWYTFLYSKNTRAAKDIGPGDFLSRIKLVAEQASWERRGLAGNASGKRAKE
jgi:hypothetical protein